MKKVTETELKVGLFVGMGVVLAALAILLLGGTKTLFSSQIVYQMHFPSVDGLIPGAKVVLGGIQVGTVETVSFDPKDRNIRVQIKVFQKYQEWLRAETMGEIATQGVLGDKYIAMSLASADGPVLPAGSEIPVRPPKDIAQFFSKSDALLISLNSIAGSMDRILKSFESGGRSEQIFSGMAMTSKNLSVATTKLSQEIEAMNLKGTSKQLYEILEKVNRGSGTVGALINDTAVYDDLKSLTGGANRNRLVRNLVRQTVNENEKDKARKPGADEEKR